MGNSAASRHAVSLGADDGLRVSRSPERGERRGVEVKIRITRRQLQELLLEKAVGGGHEEEEELTVEKVLADIVKAGEVVDRRRQHSESEAHWKPALQSIPEAVES